MGWDDLGRLPGGEVSFALSLMRDFCWAERWRVFQGVRVEGDLVCPRQ